MFKKEYIFESKLTLRKRRILNRYLIIFLILFLYLVSLLFIHLHARKLNEETNLTFFAKSPDLIAVFTGGSGRVEHALKELLRYPYAKLLISGVYSKNNLQILIEKNIPNNETKVDYLSRLVELDFQAKNTIENVLMTTQYLKSIPNIENVLIISSDYHLTRIKLLFNIITNHYPNVKFYFYGVSSTDSYFKRTQIYTIELIKILRTLPLYFSELPQHEVDSQLIPFD